MDGRNFTTALIRLLALWIAVERAIVLPGIISSWYSYLTTETQPFPAALSVYPMAINAAVALAAAAFLWKGSRRLAQFVWPSPESSAPVAVSDSALSVAALRVFGAYLLVVGVPDIADLVAGFYTVSAGYIVSTTYEGHMRARAVGVGFQMLFGLALLFAADGLRFSTIRSRIVSGVSVIRRNLSVTSTDDDV